MPSLNFKFIAVAFTYALLASAAVPNRRSIQWLQKNGPAAKALNDQYRSLTLNSSCNDDGDIACVGGQYGVCVEGRYITHTCASGWACAALPNEWSQGTTTTCATDDDISWRFSQAGVSEFRRSLPPMERSIQWLQHNGPAAKALNDQYASLNTNSSCNDGQVACIGGEFARCDQGRYLTWPCASGWTCAALPDEWDDGTTTTCASNDVISWRFSEAGVSES